MKESLTPEKIQGDFTIGDLSKENAAKLLISLIESSENTGIRAGSIKALEKINDLITLKLENGRTNIYLKNKPFRQCKSLLSHTARMDV